MIAHSRPWITASDIAAVAQQMSGGMIATGEASREFGAELLRWSGGTTAILTASGSAAQAVCLAALGVGRGDEVILPTYVCESVERVIRERGAEPIYCDSGPFWNMDLRSVKANISDRTRAIILVNIFGVEADLRDIGIPIIEDHCQSFGLSKLKNDAAFFSFHATKCLTTGEGGAAVFREATTVESNAPFSDLQAALGLSQLARYDEMLERRAAIASRYFAELPERLTGPLKSAGRSVYFRFPIRFDPEFDKIHAAFADRGIAVRRGVDRLLHRRRGFPDAAFPNAVRAFDQTISIPIYPALTQGEVGQIIDATKAIARQL